MGVLEQFMFACAPAIGYASAYGEQMLKYKTENGGKFVNAEMQVTYECYKGALQWCDDNKILDQNHRSIIVVGFNTMIPSLDEDTYYFIRWLIWLEQFFERSNAPDPDVKLPDPGDTDIGLLAYNTGGWELMHRNMKSNIFVAVWAANQIYGRKARQKNKNGWLHPEAKLFYDCMAFICEFDEGIRQKNKVDHLRSLFNGVRDGGSVMIEEEEQLRMFTRKFYELLLARRADLRLATHKTRPYFKAEYYKNRHDMEYRKQQQDAAVKAQTGKG